MPVMPPPSPQPQPGPQPGPQAGGAAPIGASPASQPTANKGHQVAAIKMMGLALIVMEQAVPLAGAATAVGGDLLSAIKLVAKHVPPGSVTPADINNVVQSLMMKQQQATQQIQQMRQQQAQPQQQPAPQAQPPGGGAAMAA